MKARISSQLEVIALSLYLAAIIKAASRGDLIGATLLSGAALFLAWSWRR